MSLLFYITPLESLNCKYLENFSQGCYYYKLCMRVYHIIVVGMSFPESLGVSAKVLVERSIQPYKLPIDPKLFE